MPKLLQNSAKQTANATTTAPEATSNPLKPYLHHRVNISTRDGSSNAIGDCPFCGKEGKFAVSLESGLWRCFVCGSGSDKGGGNVYTFLNLLHQRAAADKTPLAHLASSRKLLSGASLDKWGVRVSHLTGEFVLPSHNLDGKLVQLYRWVLDRKSGKHVLLATPEMHHGVFGAAAYDAKKPEVWWFEGPWDAIAAWEVAGQCRYAKAGDLSAGLVLTGSAANSLLASVNVLAVPGCNTFRAEWVEFCRGKVVTLFYDSDHPRKVAGKTFRAGWDGMKRAAGIVGAVAKEVRIVRWGEDGYNPKLPSGYDVRDALSSGTTIQQRIPLLASVLGKVGPTPVEWQTSTGPSQHIHPEIQPKACSKWDDVIDVCKQALKWRQSLDDALSVCLATATSTSQAGNDQIFLQLIGDAGSGKTRICDGMLVSQHCFALEHLTGFHSGWKGENGEDCSLISRINHKTLITPEGDVLMSSPRFVEIMSQQRRIFDGSTGATYKNTSEDKRWTDLRTPWIIAGTPALMDTDQSRLGDRFLRVVIDQPSEDEKRSILQRVGYNALQGLLQTSNGAAGSSVDKRMGEMYAIIGGYTNYLRDNALDLLTPIVQEELETGSITDACMHFAEFTADMRARPNTDTRKQETNDTKEMPTRLQGQYVRLACCLAVVLNRKIDGEVMRRIRKVTFDTSRGKTLDMVRIFHGKHPSPRHAGKICQDVGLMVGELASWLGMTSDRASTYLTFLRKIGVVHYVAQANSQGVWKLTDRVVNLYREVVK